MWAPSRGALLVFWRGGRVVCTRDMFILNEIWVQDKIYIWYALCVVKYFTYHLVRLLAPNCKQHILLTAKFKKVC
jgi:hypothetical protein